MKYIITEHQLEKIKGKILNIPFDALDNDWDLLQKFLSRKGNPPYIIIGDLNLYDRQDIKSLGSLIEVKGDLFLNFSSIESLGNLTSVEGDFDLNYTSIQSLGKLTSVGKTLYLDNSRIKSFGNLTYIGGDLNLDGTPISKKYTRIQIRNMVKVDGDIYL
jgi:hypothetical protein